MLKNIVNASYKMNVEYKLEFLDDHGSGASFPCDKLGNLLKDKMPDEALTNYEYCINHPEHFTTFNEVNRYAYRYKELAHGTCLCGHEVYLHNQYMGACQCEVCGRWYNLFGESLLPPDQWEEDY